MPKYQYKCNVCSGEQEVERSIHAEADNPVCCEQTMTRIFSSVPVTLTVVRKPRFCV